MANVVNLTPDQLIGGVNYRGENQTGVVTTGSGKQEPAPILGYTGNISNDYIIKILDVRPPDYVENQGVRQTIIIRALIQEPFGVRTEANWSSLPALGVVRSVFQSFTQAIASRTLTSKYLTRRMWVGTTPLKFTLKLRFEAINNATTEVTLPCQELQRMSLPFSAMGGKSGGEEVIGKMFLGAPGPNPFQVVKDKHWFTPRGLEKPGEKITITVGNFLKIKRVVVDSVVVEFANKFTIDGNPVSATATVAFSTFEIITKEELSEIYTGGLTGALAKTKQLEDQRLNSPAKMTSQGMYGVVTPPGETRLA